LGCGEGRGEGRKGEVGKGGGTFSPGYWYIELLRDYSARVWAQRALKGSRFGEGRMVVWGWS